MLHSIRELCRFRVLATDGKVGRAADFYFSDAGWSVRFVVVNTGRLFPGRRVLVPPDYLGIPNGPRRRLPIALTRRELESCARQEAHEPVSLRQRHLMEQRYGGALYGQGGEPLSEAHGAVSRQALAIAEAALEAPATEEGSLRSGQEVIGYQVEAEDGSAGVIDDLLVDDQSWKTQYFVIDTKDWQSMNPRVLMAPTWIQDVSWAESRVYMSLTRAKIKRAQRYEPGSHSPSGSPKPFLWP